MDPLIIFGAKYLIVASVLITLTLVGVVPHKERVRFVMLLIISLPIAYILAKIAGHIYWNDRPFVVGNFTPLVEHGVDNGFPSDHTLLASSLAAVVTIVRPRIGALLWVFAAIIGISRVLAGVHHALDIIGAMVIAAAAVYTTYTLLKMRLPRALRN
jgi:undecaprenyl-diphosphatase